MLAEKEQTTAYTSGPLQKNYEVVEKLCDYISENWQNQPDLADMSRDIGFSADHLQKTFSAWAGISPKEFIDALNIHEARKMLHEGENLLDASLNLGLSGPSRLHDLFIKKEAMTPGAYKNRGQGIDLSYGFEDTLFGRALFISHKSHLAGLSFCTHESEAHTLEDMQLRWPKAQFIHAPEETTLLAQAVFRVDENKTPLKIVMIGSDFDISVWEALTHIPHGAAVSYSHIAQKLGKPQAHRAVASAVGRNPISYIVPCHRVLRRDGLLGGYHWGLSRKCAMLGWEKTLS